MKGEDVYDVAKRISDDEVGECSLCLLPYTKCDCPEGAEDDMARYRETRGRCRRI